MTIIPTKAMQLIERALVDGDAEIPVRRHHLLDQRGELHAIERIAARELGQLGQDRAAARGLLVQ